MSVCSTSQRVRFQLRRATGAQWNENGTTILLAGEPGLNTTTNQLKIGDGITNWINLPYINVAGIAGEAGTATRLLPAVTLVPLGKANKTITVNLPNSIVQNQGVIFTTNRDDSAGGSIVSGTLYYSFANYDAGVGYIQVKTTRTTNVAF
jgi:hypothetical protein